MRPIGLAVRKGRVQGRINIVPGINTPARTPKSTLVLLVVDAGNRAGFAGRRR